MSYRWCALMGAVLVVAACDLPDRPTGPPALSVGTISQDTTPSQDAMAAAVPGFGGYFIDVNGAPTVWLTDPAARPAAEAALATFLAVRGYAAGDLVVRQADYAWQDLRAWYDASWPQALGVTGAVYSDMDEASNRLRFGGVDAAAVNGMTTLVLQAGVPSEAVLVGTTAPIRNVSTLRDRVRPVQAGYQINFFVSPVSPVTLVCTLGFNALSNGARSFVTNSHCSNVQGGTETPTEYYQPSRPLLPNPAEQIAVEVDDPEYDPLICPTPGFVCRYSDASRAEYVPGVEGAQGLIGRTLAPDPDLGTLEVDPARPYFTIQREQLDQVVGEQANKVGRTTGWTFGRITETCINSIVLGSEKPIMQLCQNRVLAGVDGGDSGSPVFGLVGNSGKVILYGILWGGSVNEEETSFVYSPLSGVERELGPLTTEYRVR